MTHECQNCGDVIPDQQRTHPARDIRATDNGQFEVVEDPDGPFCGVPCRRDFDAE